MRAYDFILKDKYLRGRPYQVMDREGKYIEGYENLKTYIDSQGRERKIHLIQAGIPPMVLVKRL